MERNGRIFNSIKQFKISNNSTREINLNKKPKELEIKANKKYCQQIFNKLLLITLPNYQNLDNLKSAKFLGDQDKQLDNSKLYAKSKDANITLSAFRPITKSL